MSFNRVARSITAGAAVAMVLVLGACGGGGDDASPTTAAGGSTTAAGSSSSGGGDFCTQLKATWGKLSGLPPEQVLAKLQGLADAAPDQLKADLDAIAAQQQFLVDHKNDFSSSEEYMKLNAKNLDAMKHVAQYLVQEC